MPKSKKPQAVNTVLEKAEEDFSMKTRVDPEIISSIRSREQIEEDSFRQAEEARKLAVASDLKDRLLFYGGVLGGVAVLFLVFRLFKSDTLPSPRHVQELINGTTQLASRV